jgi:hypothetical protein
MSLAGNLTLLKKPNIYSTSRSTFSSLKTLSHMVSPTTRHKLLSPKINNFLQFANFGSKIHTTAYEPFHVLKALFNIVHECIYCISKTMQCM